MNKWTEENCREESKKYKNRREFNKMNSAAYKKSKKMGWIDSFTWLESSTSVPYGYWKSYNNCLEESKKYKSRREFWKGSRAAYQEASKNQWLDDFTWLKDYKTLDKDQIDCVYKYVFLEQKTVYIGRTVDRVSRDLKHRQNPTDPISKFIILNNLSWPEMEIIEDNLTIVKGLEREDYWKNFFISEGWTVLNTAKTGIHSGSVGAIGYGKWTKESCKQESSKYNTRVEFARGNKSAYNKSLSRGWIDEFFPK